MVIDEAMPDFFGQGRPEGTLPLPVGFIPISSELLSVKGREAGHPVLFVVFDSFFMIYSSVFRMSV